MIRQFYANPPTLSQDVAALYAFPEQKALQGWREARRVQEKGRTFSQAVTADPKTLLGGLGLALGIRLLMDLMGPAGDALKLVHNRAMPRLRFYGMRLGSFAIFAAIFHAYRSEIAVPNPYSRGELK